MYVHPELTRGLAEERLEILRRAAMSRRPHRRVVGEEEIRIRLAGAADLPALERLAALDGKLLATDRHVVADVGGRLVAAVSLVDGSPIADPFFETAPVVRLLELRAQQLLGSPLPWRRPFLRLRRGSALA
jgi:hypothetical protein